MKSLAVFFLCTAAAGAQVVTAPVAGIFQNSHGENSPGEVSLVRGVSGNLLPAEPLVLQGAAPNGRLWAVSFATSVGVVKWGTDLFLIDQSGAVLSQRTGEDGPALFGFDAPGSTLMWVYFSDPRKLVDISTGVAIDTTLLGGDVIAIGPSHSGSVALLTQSMDQLSLTQVNSADGAVQSQAPVRGSAPALAFQSGWLVRSENGLSWMTADGSASPREIPLPEKARSLALASSRTVVINGRWLLNSSWQVFEIPGARVRPAHLREQSR